MAKFIEAEKLKQVVKANDWSNKAVPLAVGMIIDAMPAADVVSKETHEAVVKALQAFAETDVTQVVRCGKCTDYMPKSGICWRRSFPMSPDDYCSKGTRRAE